MYISKVLSQVIHVRVGGTGGLMVGTFDSEVNGLGSSPGRGHFVLFLGKKLKSHT